MQSKQQTATLGGGCFWCLEAAYQLIRGVEKVVPGYAGGQVAHPSYRQVCGGDTGHAEVVQITFHPSTITYPEILDIFWAIHDPTTPNRQGADVGSQYRSIILYNDDEQRRQALQSRDEAQKLWKKPVVTEIKQLEAFYEAEPEHHDYFKKHPNQAYCQVVINPKLKKLRQKFTDKLR